MSNNIPWLELKNIEVWINNKNVLSKLTLNLNYGDNIVILGPNGAGKTSLIKLIERSVYPIVSKDSKIRYFGEKNISLWDIRSKIGFVTLNIQNRICSTTKSADAICSGFFGTNKLLKYQSLTQSQKTRFRRLLEYLSIESIASNNFGNLSEGEKRTVLIARALINQPEIIILDEPTCNLDFKSKHKILEVLDKLSKDEITLVQVTHNLDSISKQTNRVIFLKNGIVKEDSTPSKCLTSSKLSDLFDTPLTIINSNSYWQALPG